MKRTYSILVYKISLVHANQIIDYTLVPAEQTIRHALKACPKEFLEMIQMYPTFVVSKFTSDVEAIHWYERIHKKFYETKKYYNDLILDYNDKHTNNQKPLVTVFLPDEFFVVDKITLPSPYAIKEETTKQDA